MTGRRDPQPGDFLLFDGTKGDWIVRVIDVHSFCEGDPAPGRSKWAVRLEVVKAHRRRYVGKIETYHLIPGDFQILAVAP